MKCKHGYTHLHIAIIIIITINHFCCHIYLSKYEMNNLIIIIGCEIKKSNEFVSLIIIVMRNLQSHIRIK
jgi:hypothetical protein